MHRKAGRPAERRAQAQEARTLAQTLLQDPNLSIDAIARRIGVSRQTVEGWNARTGVRPPCPRPSTLAAWPKSRREAAARILSVAEIDPADVSETAGFSRAAAPVLLATFGHAGPERAARMPAGTEGGVPEGFGPGPGVEQRVADVRTLRARLRAHIGRQIEALDAALCGMPPAGFDSAKVLRDLGGLKRLLDDLGSGGSEGEGEPRDEQARSDPDAVDADLERVRAEIARRFDRFDAGGAAGRVPG